MSIPGVVWSNTTFSPARRIVRTGPNAYVLEVCVGTDAMGQVGWTAETSPPSYVTAALMLALCTLLDPSTPSPDGSVLLPGTGLALLTSDGVWTFSTDTGPGGYLILLNGLSASAGSAARLQIAHGGTVYALNSADAWFTWSSPGWATSSPP